MPWLMCTTGSPTFSSDRSLISALTSLTCSCLRRRRVVGVVANSSVSVISWTGCVESIQKKPLASGAAVIAYFSSPAQNSARSLTDGGSILWSRSCSSRLSRRPSLSATSSTRWGVLVRCASSRAIGSCVPRSTLTSGSGRAKSTGSAPRTDSTACGLVRPKKSSAVRKISPGGSSGRSGSCCRKRCLSLVSVQKRWMASSTSPCKARPAVSPR
mmetsp:Transcript_10426/g.42484  ORF Transcript_10426/g.42484 Transcript_10426/m.42484 type:complete len:214 (-) Transcript_10426:718-1359(-)